jgi:hypothetical protein
MNGNARRREATAARWQACADAGMSQAEAARHLGKSAVAACLAAQRYGVKFPRGIRNPSKEASDALAK